MWNITSLYQIYPKPPLVNKEPVEANQPREDACLCNHSTPTHNLSCVARFPSACCMRKLKYMSFFLSFLLLALCYHIFLKPSQEGQYGVKSMCYALEKNQLFYVAVGVKLRLSCEVAVEYWA